MSLKIDRAELEVIIKNDKARQQMMQLEDKMRATRKELQKLGKQHGENSEEYKKQHAILRQLQDDYDNVVEEIGINNLAVRELAKRSKELNNMLNTINPNEPAFARYKKQLQEVNARLKELKGTARETEFSFGKLADGFNRYAGLAAGAIASMTGMVLTARKCVDEFASMEEAMAQVIKYTGMTKDEVVDLNARFKEMNTRTSREELNALASDAGRLGIKGADNIMRFVDAANKIRVALGEDLGEDAIKQIGKLADIFAPGAELDEGMTRIGSAINHVAQNSSASERYLVDFTARMGGTGQQARMAVTDIMGFASALDQNMIRNEMASTALQKVIMNIYKEPAKFARIAGQDVTQFTELVQNDANEAVLTFLDGLARLGGMANLAPVLEEMKLEGTEAAGVVASLAANVGKIRKEQEGAAQAFAEGTSILEEYSVQNSTVQAEIEKAQKRFLEVRVELGEKLQPAMKYMITTGSATVKMLSSLVSFLMKYGKALTVAAVSLGTLTAASKLNLAALKAQSVVTALLTVKTKLATAAQIAFNMALKAGPIGWAATAIAGIASALTLYRSKADDASTAQAGLNKQLTIAKNLQDDDKSYERLKARFDNLSRLSGDQLKRLKEDVKSELDALKNQLADKEAVYKAEEKLRVDNMEKATEQEKKFLALGHSHKTRVNKEELETMRNHIESLQAMLARIPTSNNGPGGSKDSEQMQKLKRDLNYELELIENQHALNLISEENYQSKLYEIRLRFLGRKIELLKEEGLSTEKAEQDMLSLMTMESNRKYIENRFENKSYTGTNKKKIQEFGAIDEEDPEEDNYVIEKYKKTQDGKLAILEAMHEAGVISEEEYQDKLTELHREKQQQREDITKASMQTVSELAGSLSALMGAMQEGEIKKITSKYDKQIKAARKAGKDTTKLEEQKEAEIAAVKKKYADKQFAMAVRQVTSTTAITAMEAYKAMAGIPVIGPALGAAAAAAAVVAGAAQIAVAKQQRDEAKGLYKGGYSEGYTDTGDPHEVAGVIPVHKNEFVTNHDGVANPHVRQFLDVFDMAQKNGTIGMINTTQILERVRYTGGRYEGGYTDDSPSLGVGSEAAAILRLILTAIETNGSYLSEISDKELRVDVRAVRDGINHVERLERNARR